MADGAGMAGAPLDVSGRKPGAAGGIHAVDSDAAVVVDAVHAAQGVRVVDSSGLNHILPVEAGQTLARDDLAVRRIAPARAVFGARALWGVPGTVS